MSIDASVLEERARQQKENLVGVVQELRQLGMNGTLPSGIAALPLYEQQLEADWVAQAIARELHGEQSPERKGALHKQLGMLLSRCSSMTTGHTGLYFTATGHRSAARIPEEYAAKIPQGMCNSCAHEVARGYVPSGIGTD